MGEILKTWLKTRLGVIVDLEIFSHYAKDGTLMAQLLHSYDIINSSQLNTIIHTQDPALSRINLNHLRVWLKFIGVDCDDECIDAISNGHGTMAVRLFYKVFLCLENKDRLHFITLQKERERYIPTSAKFDVTTVSEEPPPREPMDHRLAGPLCESASIVEWHRQKFQAIIDACKAERERFNRSPVSRKSAVSMMDDREEERRRKEQRESGGRRESEDLEDFSVKHKVRIPRLYTYEDLCREKKFGEEMEPALADPEAGQMYVKWMKNRSGRVVATHNLKGRMERMLLAELWEKLMRSQEKEFDLMIAKKVLSQSQYEKQMMAKLCEIREQKKRIAGNRQLVESLMREKRELEYRLELGRQHEMVVRENEEVDLESRRMCELQQRVFEGRLKRLREKHYRMCMEIMNDLVDISVKGADYRANNDNRIPKKVWNEWKALFIKNQPIFDLIKHVEHVVNPEFEEGMEEIFRAEIERQQVLNEADFESYHNMTTPWDEFVPEVEPEVREILNLGIIVLGYIVHRLLEYIYPYPPDPEAAPVPKVSSSVIVLGVSDLTVYPAIQELLKHRGIRLVRMEHAINYCLLRYKEEMRDFDYIDLNVIAATNEVRHRTDSGDETSQVRKEKKKVPSKPVKPRKTMVGVKQMDDKETQTPREIPLDDMDPNLTDTGYIGKWAYEFLTLGQPISDELNTKILIEYLKSLTEIKGWALINYPNTYDQMARLEFALTGRKIPLEVKSSDEKDANIEEIDPTPSRISFDEEELDNLSIYRQSQLVPNPIPRPMDSETLSYMTAYIKAMPKPKNMEVDETEMYEILPEDATTLDAFYVDQGLAYALYFTAFDLFTLKRLCRLIIGDTAVPRKLSTDLFGDAPETLDDKYEEPRRSLAPVVRQLVKRPESAAFEWGGEGEGDGEGEGEGALAEVLSAVDAEPPPVRPGEPDWEWIDFPQAAILMEALATLWENMETVYIQDLKEIFFIKRIHYASIVPYRKYVLRHMTEFVKRPDVKQDMLHEFHKGYNDVAPDIREDAEVKCEMHCRVADFQAELWEICERRRREAEAERRRIILEHWTAEEAVVLANLYVSIIQAELDRHVDTLQLLQDHYTSMLQRPISEARFPKHLLHRLELNPKPPELHWTQPQPAKTSKTSARGKGVASPPVIDCTRIKQQIADLLIECDREPFLPVQSICYKAVHANILCVQGIVEAMASTIADSLRKQEVAMSPKTDAKGRKQPPKKLPLSLPNVNETLMATVLARGPDLCQEWRYAALFEINRMRTRLRMLDNAALSDIGFLLGTMENVFHRNYRDLNERYRREMKSVNEMASVFCFAIEEGVPVQEELLLDGDRFVVRSNVLMYPDEPQPPTPPVEEEILPSQFRMGQLGRLMDVFRRVAPYGSLPERFFIHILQDMVACGEEEGGTVQLPSSWSQLRPSDVETLVTQLFGDVEYIDWREFIIYAMDLPMPSDEQILDARSQFLAMDPSLKEVVTREQFNSVNLWFLNCTGMDSECQPILHEGFERDEEEMYEEEELLNKSRKSTGMNLAHVTAVARPPKQLYPGQISDTFSMASENLTPQEIMRLILAKELMLEMYLTGCDSVNYTAFLLAFCKSFDAREGLGKALTLALGERVCVDEAMGEQFVVDILEQRRLAAEVEATRDFLREEALQVTTAIIAEILEQTLQFTEGVVIEEVLPPIVLEDTEEDTGGWRYTGPILIENLDDLGEPVKVLPPDLLTPEAPPVTERTLMDEAPSNESDNRLASDSTTILAEGYSEDQLGITGEPVVIHWVPREALQAVLVACLPWHARQPDLLRSTLTLREGLEQAYNDLRDEELNEEYDFALAHRLVNHRFVAELLASTSKFSSRHVGNLLDKVLQERDTSKGNC